MAPKRGKRTAYVIREAPSRSLLPPLEHLIRIARIPLDSAEIGGLTSKSRLELPERWYPGDITARWGFITNPRACLFPSIYEVPKTALTKHSRNRIEHLIAPTEYTCPSTSPANASAVPFWLRITDLTDGTRTGEEDERIGGTIRSKAGAQRIWAVIRNQILSRLRSAPVHWELGLDMERMIWSVLRMDRPISAERIEEELKKPWMGVDVVEDEEDEEDEYITKGKGKKRKAGAVKGSDKKARASLASRRESTDPPSPPSPSSSSLPTSSSIRPIPPYLYLSAYPCLSCSTSNPSSKLPEHLPNRMPSSDILSTCPCLIAGTAPPRIVPSQSSIAPGILSVHGPSSTSKSATASELLVLPQLPCLRCLWLRKDDPLHQCRYALPLGEGYLDPSRGVVLSVIFPPETLQPDRPATRREVLEEPGRYLYWMAEDVQATGMSIEGTAKGTSYAVTSELHGLATPEDIPGPSTASGEGGHENAADLDIADGAGSEDKRGAADIDNILPAPERPDGTRAATPVTTSRLSPDYFIPDTTPSTGAAGTAPILPDPPLSPELLSSLAGNAALAGIAAAPESESLSVRVLNPSLDSETLDLLGLLETFKNTASESSGSIVHDLPPNLSRIRPEHLESIPPRLRAMIGVTSHTLTSTAPDPATTEAAMPLPHLPQLNREVVLKDVIQSISAISSSLTTSSTATPDLLALIACTCQAVAFSAGAEVERLMIKKQEALALVESVMRMYDQREAERDKANPGV